jgi:hypothetical protein
MKRIYLALGVYSVLFLLVIGGLGLYVHSGGASDGVRGWHLTGGLVTAIFICFVHSTVFIHLLGTGLGVKRAIEEHALDEDAKGELYRIKMRAFPPCFASMVATIATAVLGGAALSGHPTAHLVLAIVALAANVLTLPIAVRALADNETLIARVEAALAKKVAAVAAAGVKPPV